MPKGLITGTFNEGIRMKRFLVMFQVWQRISGINPQDFSASTWERGQMIAKKDQQTNVPSSIKIHGTKWQRQ